MASNPTLKGLLRDPLDLIACGFGSGLSPIGPGTMGTVVAIPLFWLMKDWPALYYYLMLAASFLVGIYLCGRAAKQFGVHDHKAIVWDEIVGYWLTMLWLPHHWLWLTLAFAAFRVFDIVKPWPIGWLDKHVKGGLGIMLDDVLAAVYANALLQLLLWSEIINIS